MPAVNTYIPLATFTTTGTASQITFSNIPNTYRDLVIVTNVVASSAGPYDQAIRFNNDTASGYSSMIIYAAGASASQYTALVNPDRAYLDFYGSATTSQRASSIAHIFDYSVNYKHKNVITRGNRGNSGSEIIASRWKNNAVISSIQYFLISGSFGAGTTVSLYGIAG